MQSPARVAEAGPAPLLHPAVAAFLDLQAERAGALPGHGHGWVRAFRERSAGAFTRLGFPTRRTEAWHYTDLRVLTDTRFRAAPPGGLERLPDGIPDAAAPRLVFLDGRFMPGLSDLDRLPEGVRMQPLASLLEAGDTLLGERLGMLAPADAGAFVALNAMLAEDGVVIHCTAPAGAGARLHIVSLGSTAGEAPAAFHTRHLIHLAEGAELLAFESMHGLGEGCYLGNGVAEIDLEPRSKLVHVRLQSEAPSAFQVNTIAVRVAEAAEYDSFVLATGARLARNEVHATLAGPKAIAHLDGAQLGDGVRHVDTTTVIDHAAPDCSSLQTFKSVLAGRSRAVFQGKIHVHQVAQKTDGYQMNRALLLSPEAEIDAKPQLEIYADDVKCSHGATVGELDENQLFYLRSRGIPLREARAILIEAFLADALATVADEHARAALAEATSAWWHRAHEEAGA